MELCSLGLTIKTDITVLSTPISNVAVPSVWRILFPSFHDTSSFHICRRFQLVFNLMRAPGGV